MKWKIPPAIKIYEALGAVADDRVTHILNQITKMNLNILGQKSQPPTGY